MNRKSTKHPQISVDVCSPDDPALIGAWADLAARLHANVFMHPAALLAAAETGWAKIHVLVAWDQAADPPLPVGYWALRERRLLPLTPTFLETLPYHYAFSSNAMVEAAYADDVVAAFFETIRRDPRLPKVVCLKWFEAEPVYPAMLRRLAEIGCHRELLRIERPFVDRSCGLSKSARKKQRQSWRQISAAGTMEAVNDRAPAEAEAAFEKFLALEAASWKGEQGSALLCVADHARFVRRWFRDLARQGLASVVLLRLNGEAIAALVVLHSGRTAYTWKIAFNADYASLSPGIFLMCKITELLGSGPISAIDSGFASGQGWVAGLWSGRRTMVDAVIDVRPRGNWAFAAEAARHRAYDQVGLLRDLILRLKWWAGPRQGATGTASPVASSTARAPEAARPTGNAREG